MRLALTAVFLLATATVAVAEPHAAVWPLTSNGRNICTATSINTEKHYWLTAQHCVRLKDATPVVVVDAKGKDHLQQGPPEPEVLAIMGEPIIVIMRDVPNDLAIVQTPNRPGPAALKLALTGPENEDFIRMIGHPLGFPFQLTVSGKVAALDALVEKDDHPYMLVNMTGAPGNSGSAILNVLGDIVSVLQAGWGGGNFGSMMAGVPFKTLDTYRSYFSN